MRFRDVTTSAVSAAVLVAGVLIFGGPGQAAPGNAPDADASGPRIPLQCRPGDNAISVVDEYDPAWQGAASPRDALTEWLQTDEDFRLVSPEGWDTAAESPGAAHRAEHSWTVLAAHRAGARRGVARLDAEAGGWRVTSIAACQSLIEHNE